MNSNVPTSAPAAAVPASLKSPPSLDRRIEVRRLALDEVKAEFGDLWDSWKVVESKAQPIAALAGVFLGGVFAYLSQLPVNATPEERRLLLAIAVLLAVCALMSLIAIWVRSVSSPFAIASTGQDDAADILAIVQTDEELAERQERLLADAVKRWVTACKRMNRELSQKQWLLRGSIGALIAAVILAMPLVYFTLFERVITSK